MLKTYFYQFMGPKPPKKGKVNEKKENNKNYRLDSKRSEQLINRTSENLDFIQIDITFTEWKE